MEKSQGFRNIAGFPIKAPFSAQIRELFNPPKVPPFLLRSLPSGISAVIRIALREHLLTASAILASSRSASGKNWLCHGTMSLVCSTLTSHLA